MVNMVKVRRSGDGSDGFNNNARRSRSGSSKARRTSFRKSHGGFNAISMIASNLDRKRSEEPDSTSRQGLGLKEISQHSVERATKKISKAKGRSTQKIESAMNQSKRVYRESRWCLCARYIGKFPKYFPRLFSYTFGVVVPLWFLILLSAGFGVLLASYEAPHELESNHEILESRARLNRSFVNATDLGQLPLDCYLKYLNQTNRSQMEERIIEHVLDSNGSENIDAANTSVTTDVNISGSNGTSSTIYNLLEESEESLKAFMVQCQQEQSTETQAYQEVRDGHRESGADSLTFNWIRCWPKEINDEWGDRQAVYFPPLDLIEASRPAQQETAVETEFVRILNEEEINCLDLGGEEDECFEQGLWVASEGAANVCHDNVEATSWFFFTIMTTLGYGNQTPVTSEGRSLIYIAGITSLIMFAAVLGSSGYIITAIFDDAVARLPIAKFLQNPMVGVVYWGSIWVGWAYAIALYADIWWEERLPEFDVDVYDSAWFAFISTSTIGLGDYYLQPSVMFAGDALKFSVLFLVGFVLLSTFLNKLGEFLFSMLPKRQNSLEMRLRNTNLVFWKHWPCNDYMRSYMYRYEDDDDDSDNSDGSSELLGYHIVQQVKRVEAFKSHLPNKSLPPPLNTMYLERGDNMIDLLDEEEIILKVLLESVEQRRSELSLAGESTSSAVRVKPLMKGVGPPPSETDSSEGDAMSAYLRRFLSPIVRDDTEY